MKRTRLIQLEMAIADILEEYFEFDGDYKAALEDILRRLDRVYEDDDE